MGLIFWGMDSHTLGFLLASIALSLSPGPDNLFVVSQGIAYGRKPAFWAACGMVSGVLVHTLAAAFGISVVFRTSALAFNVVKYAGAGYLLYLAYRAFREHASFRPGNPPAQRSLSGLYSRGFLMNVLNPKVALFFLAFLPQFVRPDQGSVPMQMVALGILFMAQAFVVFATIAYFAGSVGYWLQRKPAMGRWLGWLSGTVFAFLGLRLLFAHRNL
ncbi:MAG: Homoserine/homoserine lactone efflux protein [Verrucomicrobia bacterium ADurb.Bin474]|nr:MAG: Homoserine/homoserine lactone efflux protein [Verrucomicrobia bacterium ADurb.Bin474]